MPKTPKKSDVVQTSITMERHLKARYSKLASKMDLSFSQLVRLGLRHVEDGVEEWVSIMSSESENKKVLQAKDMSLHPELLDKLKNNPKL